MDVGDFLLAFNTSRKRHLHRIIHVLYYAILESLLLTNSKSHSLKRHVSNETASHHEEEEVKHRKGIKQQGRNCFRDYFKDILLVIVYNHPLYDSIDKLRQFYEPVFPKIFFCGPKSINETRNNLTQLDINRGIFGYKCLAEAIRQNHMSGGFNGYFYINDDVILNYWNLINTTDFDKNFIWSSNNQYGRVSLEEDVPKGWYWWVSPYGFNDCRNAVHEIAVLAQRYKMYRTLLKQNLDNGNGIAHAHNGRSDIVYVPRKLALPFQELAKIFNKHLVFLEIAVPTILRFLAPENEIKTLKGYYIPGDVRKGDPRVIDARYFWVTYLQNPKLWFIHPFKLHHRKDKNRELNLILMEHILIWKTRTFVCEI